MKLTRKDFENYRDQILEGQKIQKRQQLMVLWNDQVLLRALEKQIDSMPKEDAPVRDNKGTQTKR